MGTADELIEILIEVIPELIKAIIVYVLLLSIPLAALKYLFS